MRLVGVCCLLLTLVVPEVACEFSPEEAQVQVVENSIHGQYEGYEGIYIKVNGHHRDNGEEVYMQVNMNVNIHEGNVIVNDQTLPFSELTTFMIQAQICEIKKDGVKGDFEDAEVTVNFFLHEQTESEQGNVTRAFRLETQIIETDKYDIHMFNVTEIVMELDSAQQEVRRTVTMISESESKLHAAKNCPQYKCVMLLGCAAYKKDSNGCQTCECAASMHSPFPLPEPVPEPELTEEPECLDSCQGVCGDDPFTHVRDPVRDANGCWMCPCVVIDTFEAPTAQIVECFRPTGEKLVRKFFELPMPLKVATIALLSLVATILTATCCVTVCCRKSQKMNKSNNLKAFGFGKLQIYVPDNEKKMPLIDNLDVVSADIA